MGTFLFWTEIISAILLILSILFQQKSAGLSGAVAGADSGSFSSKSGADKILVTATIIFAFIFFGSAIAIALVD